MKYSLVAFVLVAIIAGGWYYSQKSSNSSAEQQSTTDSAAPTSEAQSSDQTSSSATAETQAGAYVEYSSNVIAATKGTKILFFHAPWCPQCRALETDIKANTIPDGVTIIKTDYDTNQALRKKYGVTIQTTLVKVDDNGNLVEKYVAYDSPTLAAVKSNLL